MNPPENQPTQAQSSFRLSVLLGAWFASLLALLLVHFAFINPLHGFGIDTVKNPFILMVYAVASFLAAFTRLFLSSLLRGRRGIVRVGWLGLISVGLVLGSVVLVWLILVTVFFVSMSSNPGHGL